MTNPRPRPTPQQAQHFWESAADQIAAIVADAEHYLPDPEQTTAMDSATADEIVNSLMAARASADTAAGAFAREVRGYYRQQQPERQQAAQPSHFAGHSRRYGQGG